MDDIILLAKDGPGRPSMNDYHPESSSVMQEICESECIADPRRRSNVTRSLNAIKQLNDKIKERGCKIEKTATYYRTLPRNLLSRAAQRHIHTIPVLVYKPQPDEHEEHLSTRFCRGDDRNMKELAPVLGIVQFGGVGAGVGFS